MNQNKLVCICTSYYYPHFGGVERYAENMAKYLVKAGYSVVVLTTSIGSKHGMEIKDNIVIYRIPVLKMMSARFPIPALFSQEYLKIIKELKGLNFSLFIVNTRFYLTTLVGLALSGKGNTKAIIIEHGTGHFNMGNAILNFAGEIYEHTITWFIRSYFKPSFYGVSEACNRWLSHFGLKASGVIYNGIDTEEVTITDVNFKKVYNLPEGAVVFSFAGRLIAEKGIVFILDLFKDFIKKHPDAYLFVAGTGPLFQDAEKCSCKNIIILGKLAHTGVMNLLKSTDVVLIPSDYPEGLPTLILEGGFSKCAVIATDRGGAKEVIKDEHHGFIIPNLDREKFFAAMEKLMINPEYREELKENLHRLVISKFSWEIIIQKVIDIIDK